METESIPTCYRHPDRETRLACSSCGRSVCVECVRDADVGQRCPECAAIPRSPRQQVVTRRSTPVTVALLVVNVAVFAIMTVEPIGDQFFLWFAQINQLVLRNDQWWRVVTAAFLHDRGTFLHILFNMYALYLFGPQMERIVGPVPFLLLYLASAATGGLAFFLFGGVTPASNAVGASGAIFGLFGAWLVAAFKARHTSFGRQQLRSLLILLAINLALPLLPQGGFFGGKIAWEAHVGGLVAGGLIAAIWFSKRGQADDAVGGVRAAGDRTARVRSATAAAVLLVALVAVYLIRPLSVVA